MIKSNSIVVSHVKPPAVVRDECPGRKMWQTSNFEIVSDENVYVLGESALKKPYVHAVLIDDSMCNTMPALTRAAVHIFNLREQPLLMPNRSKRTTEAFRAMIPDNSVVLASWDGGDLIMCRLAYEKRSGRQSTNCKVILSFDNQALMIDQGGGALFIGREDSLVVAGVVQGVLEPVRHLLRS